MTGARILLKILKRHGVNCLYGIVGREAEAINFQEVKGLKFILTHDERSAAYMADMQGRLTGKVGVCYSTFGPGATNLITGIASAYLDRSPVLAISSQVESGSVSSLTHQCVDQAAIMKPITKYSKEIRNIDELERELKLAIKIAEEGIPGPVFLSIPWDMFRQKPSKQKKHLFNLENRAKISPAALYWDSKTRLETFVKILKQSKSPTFIIGKGVCRDKAVLPVIKLLKILNIPVVCTYSAKGIIPHQLECYLGTISKYLDYLAPGVLERLFNKVDLVVLLGFDMAEGVMPELWQFKGNPKVCAVNSLIKNQGQFIPVNLEIKLSYKLFADKLAVKIKQPFFSSKEIRALKNDIAEIKNKAIDRLAREYRNSINPIRIVGIMNSLLSDKDILISDVGMHKQFVSLFYESGKENTFFCSNGLGSMGFGLPAAIGAKNTFPKHRVVAVCGDGGFILSSSELETSVRYNLPVIFVIFSNRSFGLIQHYQSSGFKKACSAVTDFGKVDFVKLAEANGCFGYVVKSEKDFAVIFKKSLNTSKTVIIEVPLA